MAGGQGAAGRAAAVDRFLKLRPTVLARMQASVPPELQASLGQVTGRQLLALTLLPAEGLPMRGLATALGVTGAAACVLADRLVAQGLAERSADPVDRRVVRLTTTTEGKKVTGRYREAQRRAVTALLKRLTDDQVRAWLDIMETLAAEPDPLAARQGELAEAAR
ncbi:MAG: MarR family transcriptional regulator [Kitasatospora sp.]|jgi:DNA-binding MarR family transcriptional regulator|nr:MarR family transcriptional regulator [Kitasatospora sp.]